MSFNTYVERCLAARTSQQKLDIHFNGFFRDPNGDKHKIVVDLPTAKDLPSTTLSITQDIDAFIAPFTRFVPVREGLRCSLFLTPMSEEKIDTLQHGNCRIGITEIPVKNVPHTFLFSMFAFGLLKCHIFFPRMYRGYNYHAVSDTESSDSDSDSPDSPPHRSQKETFFSTAEQAHFIDFLWLPALKKVMSTYDFTNIPSSHKHAASNGYSLNSTDFIDSSYVHLAVAEMRQMIALDLELRKYKHFFFVCSSFGSKHSFSGDLDTILGSIIDWDRLDVSNVFVDVATTITDDNRVSVLLLKTTSSSSVARKFDLHNEDKLEVYPVSLGDFGGISVKQKIVGDNKPSKFIVYSSTKTTFAGKLKPHLYSGFSGKHFSAMSLWHSCSDRKTLLTHVSTFLVGLVVVYEVYLITRHFIFILGLVQ